MKKSVPLNQAKWIIEPGCVVLVAGGTMEHANLMTFSWQTPIHTADPCMILLVVNRVRYTYELIRHNHELTINVPGESLLKPTHLAGTVSGRGIDKFARCCLTPTPANVVAPPLVAECAGHLECRIVETHGVHTHDLLICMPGGRPPGGVGVCCRGRRGARARPYRVDRVFAILSVLR
jgi:flavin reductase (DIM6/NTAB) family NADH-FMN oxidoreductase RutF